MKTSLVVFGLYLCAASTVYALPTTAQSGHANSVRTGTPVNPAIQTLPRKNAGTLSTTARTATLDKKKSLSSESVSAVDDARMPLGGIYNSKNNIRSKSTQTAATSNSVKEIQDQVDSLQTQLTTLQNTVATKANAEAVAEQLVALDNKIITSDDVANAIANTATTDYVDGKVTDMATKSYVNDKVSGKADSKDVYTKEEVDMAVASVGGTDLTGYATEEYVNAKVSGKADSKDFYTKAEVDTKIAEAGTGTDLTGYATEEYVNEKVSGKADSKDVYTKEEVDAAVANAGAGADLTGYATEEYVNAKVSGKADSKDFYTKAEVDTKIAEAGTGTDLTGYATEEYVNGKVTGMATENYVDEKIATVPTNEDFNAVKDMVVDEQGKSKVYTKTEVDEELAKINLNNQTGGTITDENGNPVDVTTLIQQVVASEIATQLASLDDKYAQKGNYVSNDATYQQWLDTVQEHSTIIANLDKTYVKPADLPDMTVQLQSINDAINENTTQIATLNSTKANAEDVFTKSAMNEQLQSINDAINENTTQITTLNSTKANADDVFTQKQSNDKFATKDSQSELEKEVFGDEETGKTGLRDSIVDQNTINQMFTENMSSDEFKTAVESAATKKGFQKESDVNILIGNADISNKVNTVLQQGGYKDMKDTFNDGTNGFAALKTTVAGKANTYDVNAALADKANTSDVNAALADKADSSTVTTLSSRVNTLESQVTSLQNANAQNNEEEQQGDPGLGIDCSKPANQNDPACLNAPA